MKPAIIRRIDAQGRISIPSTIRETMELLAGDALEVRTDDQGIYLYKYQAYPLSCQNAKKYLDIFYSVMHLSIALCTADQIMTSRGICPAEGTPVSPLLSAYVQTRQAQTFQESVYAMDAERFPVDSVIPVRDPETFYTPMALLLFSPGNRKITEEERNCARLIASLITTKTN